MVEAHVLPELDRRVPGRQMIHGVIVKTTGVRESEVAELLSGLSLEGVRLGYRAHFPEVHLRVTASGRTREEARVLAERFTEEVRRRLGDCVFSTSGETLEEVVAGLLVEKGVTLSVAESCTGGLLANRLTNVPGSSGFFERGVVTYSNESKTELLGVPPGLFKTVGAVSAEVVEHMARGVRELARTDVGVGISGIAGPGGGTPEKPVGTVYIGFSHRVLGTRSERYQLSGTREQIKLAASQAALDLIRKFFLNDV
ncbi:MAG: nicotinamide-nucleotide amidohydrolase family protein [Candidatus Methanosuratincola sp.]